MLCSHRTLATGRKPPSTNDPAFLRAVLEHATDVVVVVDAHGTLRYISPAAQWVLGYEPDDYVGTNVLDLVHPDKQSAITESLGRSIAAGHGVLPLKQLDIRHADGTYRPVELASYNLLDDPAVEGFVISVRDLSARVEAEEAARASERRFRLVVDNASDVVSIVDADGIIRYMSPSVQRVLGHDAAALVGTQSRDLMHPDDVGPAEQAITEQFATGDWDRVVQYRARHADGSYRHFDALTTNLLDDPDIGGVVSTIRDVTERIKTEEELAAAQERFRALVQHSSDIIVVLDGEGRMDYISPAGERALGRASAELRATFGLDLIHPDDRDEAAIALGELLAAPDATADAGYRIMGADGTWHHFEGRGQNLLHDASVQGLVLNIRDVTERVQTEAALNAVRERFRALVQHSSDLVTIAEPDGTIRYISPSARRILGYEPEELEGEIRRDLVHPDDIDKVAGSIAGPGDHDPPVVQYRSQRKDGSWMVLEGVTIDLLEEPSIRGYVTNARDVTERVAAEQKAKQLTEVLEQSTEVVVLSDPSGAVVYANQRARTSLGVGTHHTVADLSTGASRERLRTEVMPLVQRHGVWSGELTLRTAAGDEVPVLATVQGHREHGEIVLLSTIAHDITELKKAQHRLEYEATHDTLTGLPNRAMFHEVAEQALGRATRNRTTTAILFLDLDGFKEVNDSLGHDAGDRLLIEVAKRLRVCVRAGDVVARLGGDEFCVLCEGVSDDDEILDLSRRLIDAVRAPLRLEGREVEVGTSIGIALGSEHEEGIGALVRNADVALYQAKHAGRGSAAIFDPSRQRVEGNDLF